MSRDSLPQTNTRRQRRQERRAAQRAQAKPQGRSRKGGKSGALSLPTIIGGILTVVVVLAILIINALRSNNATHAPGLANPQDLSPRATQIATGVQAPDFTLKAVNGTAYHLAAQRGHPVLLEFFAVWCPICHGEAPIMARITRDYVPRGVRVWSIMANAYGRNYEDSGGTDLRLANKDDLSWYAKTYDVTHPQLVDPTFKVTNRYGINGYPGLIVVDRTGKVIYSQAGHRPYKDIAAALNRALRSQA